MIIAGWIGLLVARAIWLVAFGAGASDLSILPPAGTTVPTNTVMATLRPDGAVLFADRQFGGTTEPMEAAPPTQLDIQLHGVRLSSDASGGTAIIRAEGLDHGRYGVGDDIVDGVVLAAIHADRITIRRRGVEESVFLREESARGPNLIQTSPAMTATSIRFAPELRDGQLAGFRITAGSDAAVLARAGLRTGDVVTHVDGQALNQGGDIPRLLNDLQTASSVALVIERDGRALSLETRLR
tara:strand:- start:5576 stop:6298 length:723 start_codon:yes stop_codon:yes gene_type:complete